MKIQENKINLKIGDTFRYNSTKPDIDSFEFTIFQINQKNVDVIINNSIYHKIKMSEFNISNLIKIE